MWFKSTTTPLIVRFDAINTGTVIVSYKGYREVGYTFNGWTDHTDTSIWTQVPEPVEEMTLDEVCQALGKTVKIVKGEK